MNEEYEDEYEEYPQELQYLQRSNERFLEAILNKDDVPEVVKHEFWGLISPAKSLSNFDEKFLKIAINERNADFAELEATMPQGRGYIIPRLLSEIKHIDLSMLGNAYKGNLLKTLHTSINVIEQQRGKQEEKVGWRSRLGF